MGKTIRYWIAGLSIAAASIAVTTPARATQQTYHLKNYANQSYCLGVSGANMSDGTALIIWPCLDDHNDQYWFFSNAYVPASNGYSEYTQIVNYQADLQSKHECIAMANNGSVSQGTQSIIWNQQYRTSDQYWWLVPAPVSGQCFYLQNVKAGQNANMVLGVAGGNMSQGTNAIIWPNSYPNGNYQNQIWCLTPGPQR